MHPIWMSLFIENMTFLGNTFSLIGVAVLQIRFFKLAGKCTVEFLASGSCKWHIENQLRSNSSGGGL